MMKNVIKQLNKLNLMSGNEYIFVCITLFLSFSVGVCAHESVGETFLETLFRCFWVTVASFFGQRMLRRLPGGIVIIVKFVYDEFKRTFSWE